jgi:hypothetical protein
VWCRRVRIGRGRLPIGLDIAWIQAHPAHDLARRLKRDFHATQLRGGTMTTNLASVRGSERRQRSLGASSSRRLCLSMVLAAGFILGGVGPAIADVDACQGVWRELAATGPRPSARRDVGVIYDSRRDRLIALSSQGTTWALDLFNVSANWVQLTGADYSSSPGFERAIYDRVGDRMVMVNSNMQVFQLSLANPSAWLPVTVFGPSPPSRKFFAAAYDDRRNRLIVYGGGPYTGIFNDIWTLDLWGTSAWTQIQPTGSAPPPTWGPTAVYDSDRDQLIVGMGATDIDYSVTNSLYSVNLSDTPAWRQLIPSGTLPSPRMLASAIYDPASQWFLMFSGYPGAAQDLWALQLSPALEWTLIPHGGLAPPGRWSSNAVLRSAGSEMIVVGGTNGSDFMDAWSLATTSAPLPPVIVSVSPAGGTVGDPVVIRGLRVDTAIDVRFNGAQASIISAQCGRLESRVPEGATTGPITVTNPYGSGMSPGSFLVGEPPVVSAAEPDSGHVSDEVRLRGLHFTGATSVVFGGTGGAQFSVESDASILAVIDSLASTGSITVTSPVGSGVSGFTFRVLVDDPRPGLLSVRDVPGDQGGRVMLRWRASDFDRPRYRRITGYRVWRRAALGSLPADAKAMPPGWMSSRTVGSITGDAPEFWESLVELPAAFLKGYAYAAPTLQDSTEDGKPYTTFFVQALTADRFVFYNSSPDSGYSVDNLAPPMPMPFTATYSPISNVLHWTASHAPDLREFRLHRGTVPNFVPSPENLVAATRDTGYVDAPGSFLYKLAAVDIHGNLSRFALVSPSGPTATPASLVSVSAQADRIVLVWYACDGAGVSATVYRRTVESDWTLVDRIAPDASGYLRYEDTAVTSGARNGYRLGIVDAGEESFAGEVWADVPALRLTMRGATPNPASDGRLRVEFSLRDGSPATLEVMDVAGRVLSTGQVGSLGPGRHTLDLSEGGRLRPGIYFLRLTQGHSQVRARAAVIR